MHGAVDDRVDQDIVEGARLSDTFRNTVHIRGYIYDHFESGRLPLHSTDWLSARLDFQTGKQTIFLLIMLRYETRRYDFTMMLAICSAIAIVVLRQISPPLRWKNALL